MKRLGLTLALVLAFFAPAWATFPTLGAQATSQNSSATTSHSVSIPTTGSTGDFILASVVFDQGTDPTVTAPSGWQVLVNQACGGGTPGCWAYMLRRVALGGESSPITVTTSSSITSHHAATRFSGSMGMLIAGPAGASGSGSASNPDPASLTPQGGARDFFWYQTLFISNTGSDVCATIQPSGYSNCQCAPNSGTTVCSAARTNNAASEDAGIWSVSPGGATTWATMTIAIYPTVGIAPVQQCPAATSSTTATTNHTINLPTFFHSSGDLFVALLTSDGTPTVTFPAGWTSLKSIDNGARTVVYYRQTDGSEASTMTVTTSASEDVAARVLCFRGHENPSVRAPEVSTGATGSSTTPDADTVTPSYGTKDYLFVPVFGTDGSTTLTTEPSTYFGAARTSSSGGAGDSVSVGNAMTQLNASSANPGSFTNADSRPWAAFTIAVPPDEADSTIARRRIISSKREPSLLDWFLTPRAWAAEAVQNQLRAQEVHRAIR